MWEPFDSENFNVVFKQTESSMYVEEDKGLLYFNNDFYFNINDLLNGAEIWKYVIEQ